MPTENRSPKDFLKKMDAGDFDGNLVNEINKLSREHLDEIVQILMERDARPRSRPGGYSR